MGELDLFAEADAPGPTGVWSILDVTRRAHRVVEAGFGRIWVRGEVTGFKKYRSGHWYFTLRDKQAQVRCVMWRLDNRRLRGVPEEGTQVHVAARPTVWEERGELRLTVKQLLPTAADGLWQVELEQAKAALERDGLLDASRKRRLPPYPSRIAVVTSPDGAAVRDIISVLTRRWPSTELLVVPTRVQGDGAVQELCAALALVNRIPALDLVILARGGGAREDLWAFNRERVARAVASLAAPSISAVGHETDTSLTDLVADVRSPTPSAAAEAAVPDCRSELEGLDDLARRLAGGLTSRTQLANERLERTADRLTAGTQARFEREGSRLVQLGAELEALSPLRVLARGYAVARNREGSLLRRVGQFAPNQTFRLTVSDGDVEARAVGDSP